MNSFQKAIHPEPKSYLKLRDYDTSGCLHQRSCQGTGSGISGNTANRLFAIEFQQVTQLISLGP